MSTRQVGAASRATRSDGLAPGQAVAQSAITLAILSKLGLGALPSASLLKIANINRHSCHLSPTKGRVAERVDEASLMVRGIRHAPLADTETMPVNVPRVLLEGRPGVGKTTVIRTLVSLLQRTRVPVCGFTTAEVRKHGQRVGFTIQAIDGPQAVLARKNWPGDLTVGSYGVDLAALEEVALPALTRPGQHCGAVVVDELGRMELASTALVAAVRNLFTADLTIIATVHVAAHPFTDELKTRPDVELIRVTAGNRDSLPGQLAARVPHPDATPEGESPAG